MIKLNDRVIVQTNYSLIREGVVKIIKKDRNKTMYLISLDDYPISIWFLSDTNSKTNIHIENVI